MGYIPLRFVTLVRASRSTFRSENAVNGFKAATRPARMIRAIIETLEDRRLLSAIPSLAAILQQDSSMIEACRDHLSGCNNAAHVTTRGAYSRFRTANAQ